LDGFKSLCRYHLECMYWVADKTCCMMPLSSPWNRGPSKLEIPTLRSNS
jgi:hypothetical protein